MAYEPTNGEVPLAEIPAYGGRGGDITSGRHYAAKKFVELFGRNPTASELTMLAPAYVGGDQNFANIGQGDAAIAQYFQLLSNTPDQINKRNQQKYAQEANQHFGTINQLFQANLGREATPEELNHFGSELASGSADSYQLQQFLQQQPEYQTRQNESFQQKLGGQLAGFDREYFDKSILPSIQETYAKQGRSFDSSSFKAAATNAAQTQNVDRQKYIAGLSAQQYGGVQDRAYQDYANMVAQQQNMKNFGLQSQIGGMQNMQGRLNEITDFNTQSQLYNQYLARYGKRQGSGMGPGMGSLLGMGLGAALAAPTGGMSIPMGMMLGGAGGGAAGSMFGGGSY